MVKKAIEHAEGDNVVTIVSAHDLEINTTFKRATSAMFSTWARVLHYNWQQGTVACKDRGEVSRTNRKPWKQKGTGRARAGSARSPLWKGGGVVFGPQSRIRTLRVAKKTKQAVLLSMLADAIEQKKLLCVQWMVEGEKPKTSAAHTLLKNLGLTHKKIILFADPYDFLIVSSFANLPLVQLLSFDQANAHDLANSDCWLFLKKDFVYFKDMVSRWV